MIDLKMVSWVVLLAGKGLSDWNTIEALFIATKIIRNMGIWL